MSDTVPGVPQSQDQDVSSLAMSKEGESTPVNENNRASLTAALDILQTLKSTIQTQVLGQE